MVRLRQYGTTPPPPTDNGCHCAHFSKWTKVPPLLPPGPRDSLPGLQRESCLRRPLRDERLDVIYGEESEPGGKLPDHHQTLPNGLTPATVPADTMTHGHLPDGCCSDSRNLEVDRFPVVILVMPSCTQWVKAPGGEWRRTRGAREVTFNGKLPRSMGCNPLNVAVSHGPMGNRTASSTPSRPTGRRRRRCRCRGCHARWSRCRGLPGVVRTHARRPDRRRSTSNPGSG